MPSLDILIPAFNAEHCLDGTLGAIFGQAIPADLELGVIVVNNRSTDGTGDLIEKWAGKGVQRLDHHDIQSRASARNAAAAASMADYVLLLDADCRLVGRDCLQTVSVTMAQDVGAGFGYTTGSADDFWERYHRALEAERIAAGWQGFTTACCLIKRELFAAVGGFSTEYEHYGFEDRDFICRLRAHASANDIRPLPELQAIHDDAMTVQAVCEKMYISGRYSSAIFRRNFPDEYLATGYAHVDVDTASTTMVLALKVLQPMRPVLIRMASYLTERRSTPLAIGRPAIKLCSALSFFQGTVDRDRSE